MTGFPKLSDWEREFKPHRDHIHRLNGNAVERFTETLEIMKEADCTKLTDKELSRRLVQIVESGQLEVAESVAVQESAIRLSRREL